MKRVFFFWAVFLIIAAGVASAQDVRTVNGIQVISNGKSPNPPKGILARLVLMEDFTIGDSENLDEMVSEPGSIAVDDQENIYVLDVKEHNIKVFDRDGGYLRTIGKKGQGPGELNTPVSLILTPEKELMVEDALNRRLVFFSREGEFLRNVSVADRTSIVSLVMNKAGEMAGRELMIEGEKLFWYIRKFDKDLKTLFDLDKVEFQNPLQSKIDPFDFIQPYIFDERGYLYYGRGKEYVIQVFSGDGRQIQSIEKKHAPEKVTQEDIDKIMKLIPDVGPINLRERIEFPKYYPAYETFSKDSEGRLFVRTFNKAKNEGEFFLDVFDRDGRYIASLATKSSPRLWKNGKMYAIEEAEDGIRVIKRYSAEWKK
ncbi:MAG: 6-bladed beta-propeller [Candidatus Aminicenantes bacterium]|nr:6-bladed beta-propeller [Candidatus Aminicenantes bacterium]